MNNPSPFSSFVEEDAFSIFLTMETATKLYNFKKKMGFETYDETISKILEWGGDEIKI